MSEREHIIRFEEGYDCKKFECQWDKDGCKPGEDGFHGISGMKIRFLVKGEEGAVQFLLATGWLPQFAENGICGRRIETWGVESGSAGYYPQPWDLGYHAKKPRYEGHTKLDGSCEYTGGDCYYDGSSLNASDPFYALVNGGEKALWDFLDAYYDCVFGDGEYPEPAEYPKARRMS